MVQPQLKPSRTSSNRGSRSGTRRFSKASLSRGRIAGSIICGALPALTPAVPCRGGAVLLSRDSTLQASGGAGSAAPESFNLSSGTTNFNPYSNLIGNATGAPNDTQAHQYSVPGTSSQGLQGAYAEGSVQAELTGPGGAAQAGSVFDMSFRVTGAPVKYTFGGAFGSAGTGSVLARLQSTSAGSHAVFDASIAPGTGASRSISQQGTLAPGTYGLTLWAKARGTSASSSACFTANLTLASSAGGSGAGGAPAAAPLPRAVWPGLMMLGTLASFSLRRGLRRAA